MGGFFYQIAIFLLAFGSRLAALFNPKIKLFVDGRKSIWTDLAKRFPKDNVVWFHAASLGEFEQGKPVMELLKKQHPQINLLVTFYSPSGFEARKNYDLADVFYLPIDTTKNAKRFVNLVNPTLAVFIRYEFWANFLDMLHQRNIPTAVIAAQFEKKMPTFGFWGGYIRSKIKRIDQIMVQYQSAKTLLATFQFDHKKVHVCGDSRFDRVLETVKNAQEIPEIDQFKGDAPLLILGSCYQQEEDFVREAFAKFPNWKFIYAPHYVDDTYVDALIKRLPGPAVKFTEYKKGNQRILVLNTIGKLAATYAYGNIAVVGGGFKTGIHNILEPAAFGLPLFFGPNHHYFPEAKALLAAGLADEIDKNEAAKSRLIQFMSDEDLRKNQHQKLQDFVATHAGATERIAAILNKYMV